MQTAGWLASFCSFFILLQAPVIEKISQVSSNWNALENIPNHHHKEKTKADALGAQIYGQFVFVVRYSNERRDDMAYFFYIISSYLRSYPILSIAHVITDIY